MADGMTTRRRPVLIRTAACLAGTGLLMGMVAPAVAAATTDQTTQSSSAEFLQQALDRAQQAVVDAQAELDEAKAAEQQAYDDLDKAWQQAQDGVVSEIEKVIAARVALEAAQAALDAAEKAVDDAIKDLDELKAKVEQAQAKVDQTAVDGKDALDIVARDYVNRVAGPEAQKLLYCTINANSTNCKKWTAEFEKALAAHEEFAAPYQEASDAYQAALGELIDAKTRYELAQSNVGDIAVEVLRAARDEAQKLFDRSVEQLIEQVKNQASALADAGIEVGKAEAKTELKRGKLRTAKAVLAELIKQVGPVGDGTHNDAMESESEILDGTGEDNFGVSAAPEPAPAPEVPEVPEVPVTPPSGSVTTVTSKVVFTMNASGKWAATTSMPASMPKGATFTVKSPKKAKAKHLKAAKAKAKKMATKHKGTYKGVTKSSALKKPRIIVSWTSQTS